MNTNDKAWSPGVGRWHRRSCLCSPKAKKICGKESQAGMRVPLKNFLISCLICSLAAAQPSTEPTTQPATTRSALPSAQEVIDRYIEATGGKAAYESLKTRRAEGTFSMADLGVEAKMTVLLRSDDRAIVTIEVPNVGTFRQGMGDGIVWTIRPTDGPRILTGAEAAATARTLRMDSEINLDGYRDAKVLDVVSLNGRAAYRMQLTALADTLETRFYDVDSRLLVRTIGKTGSALGEITVSSNFTDYEDVPPIRMPMKVQQMLPGASPESAMTRVEHNVEIPDEAFALPAEIVELRKQQAATQPATQGATQPATTQATG
jgi:hypothetical protein